MIISNNVKDYKTLVFWVETEEAGEKLAKILNTKFDYNAKYVGLYQMPMRDHCVQINVPYQDVSCVTKFVNSLSTY